MAQVKSCVLHEAGLRTCGTTRQQPTALFALEQPFLKHLPPQPLLAREQRQGNAALYCLADDAPHL